MKAEVFAPPVARHAARDSNPDLSSSRPSLLEQESDFRPTATELVFCCRSSRLRDTRQCRCECPPVLQIIKMCLFDDTILTGQRQFGFSGLPDDKVRLNGSLPKVETAGRIEIAATSASEMDRYPH